MKRALRGAVILAWALALGGGCASRGPATQEGELELVTRRPSPVDAPAQLTARVMPVRTLDEARAAAPAQPLSPAAVPTATARESAMVEVFPHVRVDRAAKIVEFDGAVSVDCHEETTPRVYLELFVCIPDTREHESLVVTKAKPSHIHAAMLVAGLQPGTPGGVQWTGERVQLVPPTGSPVTLRFRTTDAAGEVHDDDPWSWVTVLSGASGVKKGEFIFAGSRFAQRRDPETGRTGEVYDADGAGTVVGLTTFGSELIGWSRVLSPDSALLEPDWIADGASVPKVGTPVVVVISAKH